VLGRLAAWLLREPFEPAGKDRSVRLPVQKRSIARQLVMAQATLSRCFRRLVELGCIEMHGYVVLIRDVQALQALAGGTPAR
jgi:CRP-like cAMP-binding protein